MQILVACEESQRVTAEMRKLGHEAYSCDIEPCSGRHPEWHIQHDVIPLLNGTCSFETADGKMHSIHGKWDMIIAFPPCTYLESYHRILIKITKSKVVFQTDDPICMNTAYKILKTCLFQRFSQLYSTVCLSVALIGCTFSFVIFGDYCVCMVFSELRLNKNDFNARKSLLPFNWLQALLAYRISPF